MFNFTKLIIQHVSNRSDYNKLNILISQIKSSYHYSLILCSMWVMVKLEMLHFYVWEIYSRFDYKLRALTQIRARSENQRMIFSPGFKDSMLLKTAIKSVLNQRHFFGRLSPKLKKSERKVGVNKPKQFIFWKISSDLKLLKFLIQNSCMWIQQWQTIIQQNQ